MVWCGVVCATAGQSTDNDRDGEIDIVIEGPLDGVAVHHDTIGL